MLQSSHFFFDHLPFLLFTLLGWGQHNLCFIGSISEQMFLRLYHKFENIGLLAQLAFQLQIKFSVCADLDSCLHLILDDTCVLSASRTWHHLEHYARWCWWPHQPPIGGSPFASKVGARINVCPKSWNFSDQQSKQQQGPSLNALQLFV